MDKVDIGIALTAAAVVVGICQLVVGYFQLEVQRRIDLNILVVWFLFAVVVCVHAHSFYLLATSERTMNLMRQLTLNIAAIGFGPLLSVAWLLKTFMRESFEQKLRP